MNKCDYYKKRPTHRYTYHPITGRPIAHDVEVGYCSGTRECDDCNCDGDRTKCDFYPEVREKAQREAAEKDVYAQIKFLEEMLAKAKADMPHFCSLCAHYDAELNERRCDIPNRGCQWKWRGEA